MKLRNGLNSALPMVLILVVLTACSSTNDQTEESNEEKFDSTMFLPRTDLIRVSELRTPAGQTWLVKETPMLDSSLVNVSVEVRGFGGDSVTFDFGEIDPVIALRQDDLDKNGFAEFYVITQSTGLDAFGTIYGLCSHEDGTISIISYEGASPYTMKEGEPYEGYGGHDNFVFHDGVLTNSFPVDKADDLKAQALGDRKVIYELVNTETSVVLRPVRKK